MVKKRSNITFYGGPLGPPHPLFCIFALLSIIIIPIWAASKIPRSVERFKVSDCLITAGKDIWEVTQVHKVKEVGKFSYRTEYTHVYRKNEIFSGEIEFDSPQRKIPCPRELLDEQS